MPNRQREQVGEEAESLSVKSAFGEVRASGKVTAIILAVALLCALLAYQQYVSDQKSDMNFTALERRQQANVKVILESQKELTDSISIQTWMSTKTDAQKQALHLDVPAALCRRLDCARLPTDRAR